MCCFTLLFCRLMRWIGVEDIWSLPKIIQFSWRCISIANECGTTYSVSFFWNVFDTVISLKVSLSVWRHFRNQIRTKDNLIRRDIPQPDS